MLCGLGGIATKIPRASNPVQHFDIYTSILTFYSYEMAQCSNQDSV
jgi:hypothetical protein